MLLASRGRPPPLLPSRCRRRPQRLRGWGRGLLGRAGPLIPGERRLLIKRLSRGAAYGLGTKAVLTAHTSWRKLASQPLTVLLGYLRWVQGAGGRCLGVNRHEPGEASPRMRVSGRTER